jgi:hypothetical protein
MGIWKLAGLGGVGPYLACGKRASSSGSSKFLIYARRRGACFDGRLVATAVSTQGHGVRTFSEVGRRWCVWRQAGEGAELMAWIGY